jgi:hypothetical protein
MIERLSLIRRLHPFVRLYLYHCIDKTLHSGGNPKASPSLTGQEGSK